MPCTTEDYLNICKAIYNLTWYTRGMEYDTAISRTYFDQCTDEDNCIIVEILENQPYAPNFSLRSFKNNIFVYEYPIKTSNNLTLTELCALKALCDILNDSYNKAAMRASITGTNYFMISRKSAPKVVISAHEHARLQDQLEDNASASKQAKLVFGS